jgi:hypothetical protein
MSTAYDILRQNPSLFREYIRVITSMIDLKVPGAIEIFDDMGIDEHMFTSRSEMIRESIFAIKEETEESLSLKSGELRALLEQQPELYLF